MRVLIAAAIQTNKCGSWEDQTFYTGRLLEGRGADVFYCFTGTLSDHVRCAYGLGDSVRDGLGDGTGASRSVWREAMTAINPDIVWVHFIPLYTLLLWDMRRHLPRARICLTDHNGRGMPGRNSLKAAARTVRSALFVRRIDAYLPVSDYLGRVLAEVDRVPRERITVVHNGVDVERYRPCDGGPVDAQKPDAACDLFAVAELRERKGIGVLLETLARLAARGIYPAASIAGDGPERPRYERFASDHNLNVRFLGRRSDVDTLVRRADVTIVPSIAPEAFGLAAAESIASGVPVIASRTGGLPEIVDHEVNGLLVPPGDPDALAGAIHRMVRDRDFRALLASGSRPKALRCFDMRTQSERIVEILLDGQDNSSSLTA